ncbi:MULTISPECIES: class I SAM-dependent methyltransferase [Paenibacillus]|uniref:class I SAM-dependent DNA methyltransferase n=1 Tax=Paenibacillus TaxID=44249 RepID=UPI00038F5404|nr:MULTISPECIES: class I SAM-dependent methyltransferase [Paenibacillus]KKC47123.1 methyltransferase type 12 [Paenibacillus sp. D9]CDN45435.1 Putative methyltransferase YqeM [Paenibacillus sp. P22]
MRAYRQFAGVYDRLMEDMPYPDWIRFMRECWERYGVPESIADLGCGTGSLSIPLAKSGFRVYGIDLSADMLSIARSKWDETPQQAIRSNAGSVRWLQQDMRDWELPDPVDAAISFCDCLNYLTEEEDIEAAFKATFRGLKDGGVFLFDVHAPSTLRRYAEEQPFFLDERDVGYIWTSELEEDRIEIRHHLTIFAKDAGDRDGRFIRFEETHLQRAYDPDWIVRALKAAGFSRVDRYGDFKLREPGPDSERLFFAAVK